MKNYETETELMRQVTSNIDGMEYIGIEEEYGCVQSIYRDYNNNENRVEVLIVKEDLFDLGVYTSDGVQVFSNVFFSIEEVTNNLKINANKLSHVNY
tara:strand:- start:1051 stop:1341 length:291 start_codon:yes stop_codon:yes gene_type:complete